MRFYNVSTAEISSIVTQLKSKKIEIDEVLEAFPRYVDNVNKIASSYDVKPKLIKIIEEKNGIYAVYCSVRTAEIREKLNDNMISYTNNTMDENYDEIIGIKKQKLQFFDIVWLPNNGNWVEIRMDNHEIYSKKSYEFAHDIVAKKLGIEKLCINLFPLIESIYNKSDEGAIVEIAFTTNTASIKNEKMRRTKNKLCLREEIYHKAGTKALSSQINIFRVGIQWNVSNNIENGYFCELYFHGNQTLLHLSEPKLYSVIMKECRNKYDYNFLRNKILEHYIAINRTDEAA